MTRAAFVLRALAAVALAVLTLFGTVSATSAHAQLVASIPGAGERVDAAPSQVVLVFSERLDPLGTGLDVLDSQGKLIVTGGQIDPSDPRTISLALPPLSDGLYTVNWRSLSADDGHSTQGFFNFGVGEVAVPGVGTQSGGDVHAGHGLVQSVLETLGRMLGDLGAMLAFGLAIVLAWVVRPTSNELAERLRAWPGITLLIGAAGAAIVLITAASSATVDPLAYAGSSGAGQLLLARALLGVVAGAAAISLARVASRWALPFAAFAGLCATVLLAASGHSAGFDALGPIGVAVVHIDAAGTWLAGLLVLAAVALHRPGGFSQLVRPMTHQFTAVAIVSAALFIVSGAYLWWLVNRSIIDTSSSYSTLLLIKALLVMCALAIGALNFLGWRDHGRFGPLNQIPIEAALVLVVVAVTALVASGSPPGPTRPIPIAREASSAAAGLDATLAVIPGRPGPNQIVINIPGGVAADESVTVVLDRLDQILETTLSPAAVAGGGAGAGSTFTTDAILPAGSQWDASVRVTQAGQETGRARFGFSLTADGSLVGAVQPPIDPLLVLALLFAAGAVLGITLALAGGWLPRADPTASRRALVLGSAAAVVAAICALAAGPQL